VRCSRASSSLWCSLKHSMWGFMLSVLKEIINSSPLLLNSPGIVMKDIYLIRWYCVSVGLWSHTICNQYILSIFVLVLLSLERRGTSMGDNRNIDNKWHMIITYAVSNKMCQHPLACEFRCQLCVVHSSSQKSSVSNTDEGHGLNH
jgi:hypothetical protein